MDNADIGLISVIMPAYNAENTIEKAISSVCSQTYRNLELIIVDDGSADKTQMIIGEYACQDTRIRQIVHASNQGVSISRSDGVQMAKGNWIAFLDSDDSWAQDKLSKQVSQQMQTGADLLYTGAHFVRWDGEPIEYVMRVPNEIQYGQLLKQNCIPNSSVLIRKDLYQMNCVIRDDLHEDFACWLRTLRSGKKACGIDEPLITYRISPQSKSGNKIKSAVMCWNTYRAIGLNVFKAGYCMIWYVRTGLTKYRNLQ